MARSVVHTLKRNLHAHNKNFATLLVNMGKTVRKARITSKQRRSWCAREKLTSYATVTDWVKRRGMKSMVNLLDFSQRTDGG